MANSTLKSLSLASCMGFTRSSSSSSDEESPGVRNFRFISDVARGGSFQPLICILAEATRSSKASICSRRRMSPRNDVSLDHEPSTSGKAAPPMSLTSSEFRNSLSSKSLGFPYNKKKKDGRYNSVKMSRTKWCQKFEAIRETRSHDHKTHSCKNKNKK